MSPSIVQVRGLEILSFSHFTHKTNQSTLRTNVMIITTIYSRIPSEYHWYNAWFCDNWFIRLIREVPILWINVHVYTNAMHNISLFYSVSFVSTKLSTQWKEERMHDVNVNANMNANAWFEYESNVNPSEVKGGKRTLAYSKLNSWDTSLLLQQMDHTLRSKIGLANL